MLEKLLKQFIQESLSNSTFEQFLAISRLFLDLEAVYSGIPFSLANFLGNLSNPIELPPSLRALLNPDAADKEETAVGGPFGGPGGRRKKKRSKWNKKKIKTGRRLLLQQGCILTLASPRRESTEDSAS